MMKRRDVLAGAAALAASPALAQISSPPEPAGPAPAAPVRVNIKTGQGLIVLELYPDKAPITVANFLRYVDTKRYDGSSRSLMRAP
jgi:peptidyl-prolyl cis-trans isomerase A (cyclophilin A)